MDKHTARVFLETFIRELNVSIETAELALSDGTVEHAEMHEAKNKLREAKMWLNECLAKEEK